MQRAALHDLAEELGLAHDSEGDGEGRRLVAWRVEEGEHSDEDSDEDSGEESDEEEDEDSEDEENSEDAFN